MAEQNPPGFLQNAGATHTAEEMRNWISHLTAMRTGATTLIPRGGVSNLGNRLNVQQAAAPNMTVVVKSGSAVIPGSEGARQGAYAVLNDADVTLSITAADPTLARIDIVCFKVQDTAYSGGVNSSSLVVVTGTPSGSPAVPTAPNNSITLAQIAVGAAVTSIVNANITDKRLWLASIGGIIRCTSGAGLPTAANAQAGQAVYESDTNRLRITDGTTWFDFGSSLERLAWSTYTPTWTAPTTNPVIGNGTLSGSYVQIGKTGLLNIILQAGSTTTFGTGAWSWALPPGWTSVTSPTSRCIGSCLMRDQSSGLHQLGMPFVGSAATTFDVRGSAFAQVSNLGPVAWAVSDSVNISIVMELA